jgi:hypothetical protein
MSEQLEVLQQRIKHHEDEAANLDLLYQQWEDQLRVESAKPGLNRTGLVGTVIPGLERFVRELDKIERLRATNRAVRNELECLRVLMGG